MNLLLWFLGCLLYDWSGRSVDSATQQGLLALISQAMNIKSLLWKLQSVAENQPMLKPRECSSTLTLTQHQLCPQLTRLACLSRSGQHQRSRRGAGHPHHTHEARLVVYLSRATTRARGGRLLANLFQLPTDNSETRLQQASLRSTDA